MEKNARDCGEHELVNAENDGRDTSRAHGRTVEDIDQSGMLEITNETTAGF
jgi:hypothetical protein